MRVLQHAAHSSTVDDCVSAATVSCAVPAERPDFLTSYRLGDLDAFYGIPPGDTATALDVDRHPDRAKLVSALRAQADRFGAPDASLRNLERLSDPAARAVVTGQQTGLLLGPNYTLSKAVSAVRLAARLDRPDRPVVPIFWLATQDHDVAEVDHAFLLGLDERLTRVSVDLPNGVPTGRIPWQDAWLDDVTESLDGVAAPSVHREEVRGLLAAAASSATVFSDWFGGLLARLLGPAGLVVLDPMDPAVAELGAPVLEAELREPAASVDALERAARRLQEMGFSPQLGRAESATNLFLSENDVGLPQRRLLRRANGGLRTNDRTYDLDELRARLEDDPTCITPAAGLRPIVQDAILPTATIVVGPGELRYFAQLRGVYEHHGIAMPLVWPRATATFAEPPVRRILGTYDLDVPTYLRSPETHRERELLVRNDAWDRFADALAALDRDTRALFTSVSVIDPTLGRTVTKSHATLERVVERLRKKAAAALEREDRVTAGHFERLRAHLLPRDAPQERVLSPFSLFLKFGVEPVLAAWSRLPDEGDHVMEL